MYSYSPNAASSTLCTSAVNCSVYVECTALSNFRVISTDDTNTRSRAGVALHDTAREVAQLTYNNTRAGVSPRQQVSGGIINDNESEPWSTERAHAITRITRKWERASENKALKPEEASQKHTRAMQRSQNSLRGELSQSYAKKCMYSYTRVRNAEETNRTVHKALSIRGESSARSCLAGKMWSTTATKRSHESTQ